MHIEAMKSIIRQTVVREGGALFFQLVESIGSEARGRTVLTLPVFQNVILWVNVSDTFAEAVNQVLPEFDIHRANPMMYAYFSEDDGYPALPIVTPVQWRDRDLNFDKPHWLPLVFLPKAAEVEEQAAQAA